MRKRLLFGALMGLMSVSAVATLAAQDDSLGAKDLFRAQLTKPGAQLNNGVQYWIELKQKTGSRQVTNKYDFRSGDQIRFHIKSNVNAFAYVILSEGSQGERAVLFPAPGHADNNRVTANTDYALPDDGFLMFDKNPGREKVTLVLSRSEINPNQFIPDTFHDKVVIASAQTGSKDLIPGSFVVAMAETPKPAAVTTAKTETLAVDTPQDSSNAIVTVVQKNPLQALALDVLLQHLP